MTTALLIIDVQQALCTGPEAGWNIAPVIQHINTLSTKARAAAAPVVLIQHEEPSGPLQHASQGWQLAADLTTHPGDLRLRKTTPDSFHNTNLQQLLQEHSVTRLIICGLQTDFCVDTTTRRALALGYPVTLPADAHTTLDNRILSAAQIIAHHNLTLSHIGSFGPRVTLTPSAEVSFEI